MWTKDPRSHVPSSLKLMVLPNSAQKLIFTDRIFVVKSHINHTQPINYRYYSACTELAKATVRNGIRSSSGRIYIYTCTNILQHKNFRGLCLTRENFQF